MPAFPPKPFLRAESPISPNLKNISRGFANHLAQEFSFRKTESVELPHYPSVVEIFKKRKMSSVRLDFS